MIADDGHEIELSNLHDKSITANNEQVKYTEFFLEGSFQDGNLEIIKQRLKALCDDIEAEEFSDLEQQWVLGDPGQLPSLQIKPMAKKKGRTHSNKDDNSLDTIKGGWDECSRENKYALGTRKIGILCFHVFRNFSSLAFSSILRNGFLRC